jgi:hypothetical protein
MEDRADTIYYNELIVSYKKSAKGQYYKKEVWCVSRSNDILDILDEPLAMSRMLSQCYPSTYKGEKKLIINDIVNSKLLWKKPTNT